MLLSKKMYYPSLKCKLLGRTPVGVAKRLYETGRYQKFFVYRSRYSISQNEPSKMMLLYIDMNPGKIISYDKVSL